MWQIISCSLIGLLIIAVRNFQRFSDRSFVSAFELIFVLKLYENTTVGLLVNSFLTTSSSLCHINLLSFARWCMQVVVFPKGGESSNQLRWFTVAKIELYF